MKTNLEMAREWADATKRIMEGLPVGEKDVYLHIAMLGHYVCNALEDAERTNRARYINSLNTGWDYGYERASNNRTNQGT